MANDYMKNVNLDSGYDVSALLGGSVNATGNMLSDYASIKNGSYGKLTTWQRKGKTIRPDVKI